MGYRTDKGEIRKEVKIMNHALVKSVKETTSIEEVNKLLEDDNWRLAHVTSSSGGTLKFCLGKMRKSEFRSAITATRDMV